jgi:NADH-quinone oxidoreductase subunit A
VSSSPLWPLALYFAGVLILVGGMMGLSYVLGQRHKDPATDEPFESGIKPTGPAHVRLSIKFYLVAVFFVVFDLEAAFIYAWAVAVRDLGWAGYAEILVFVGVLVAGLVYLWRQGALDWGTTRRQRQEIRPYRVEVTSGEPATAVQQPVATAAPGYEQSETRPELEHAPEAAREKTR